jgi:hypothetical protein
MNTQERDACGSVRHRVQTASLARDVIRGREHLAASRIHPRANPDSRHLQPVEGGDGERVECRDPDDRTSRHHRDTLHGGKADAEPGERARSARDGQQVDVGQRHSRGQEDGVQFAGQALAMRVRHVALRDREHGIVAEHGCTAGASGGVEGQDEHG